MDKSKFKLEDPLCKHIGIKKINFFRMSQELEINPDPTSGCLQWESMRQDLIYSLIRVNMTQLQV